MTACGNEHVNLEINNLIDETKTKQALQKKSQNNILMQLFKHDNNQKDIEFDDLKQKNRVAESSNVSNVPQEIERERWDSFMEYFLSIIGFVIDLGKCFYFN